MASEPPVGHRSECILVVAGGVRLDPSLAAAISFVANSDSKTRSAAAADPQLTKNLISLLPPPAFVIAADSGADHAQELGLNVDLAIGDFDSIRPATLEWLEGSEAQIRRHPVGKDQTDLELALARASASAATLGVDELLVVGIDGGRTDHWLANFMVLAGRATVGLSTRAITGLGELSEVTVVRSHTSFVGTQGDMLSLIPVGGAAINVTTSGLLYPLKGEDLRWDSARGLSNEFVSSEASVSVASGVLLAVRSLGAPTSPGKHE